MEAAAAYKKCNINEHTKTDLSARQLLNYQQIVFLIGVPPSLKFCRDNTAPELSRQENCYKGRNQIHTGFTQTSLRFRHIHFRADAILRLAKGKALFISGNALEKNSASRSAGKDPVHRSTYRPYGNPSL